MTVVYVKLRLRVWSCTCIHFKKQLCVILIVGKQERSRQMWSDCVEILQRVSQYMLKQWRMLKYMHLYVRQNRYVRVTFTPFFYTIMPTNSKSDLFGTLSEFRKTGTQELSKNMSSVMSTPASKNAPKSGNLISTELEKRERDMIEQRQHINQ